MFNSMTVLMLIIGIAAITLIWVLTIALGTHLSVVSELMTTINKLTEDIMDLHHVHEVKEKEKDE